MRLNRSPLLAMALGLVLPAMSAVSAHAEDDAWLTNYAQAQRESQETGKPILADFTGSDWCSWCIKLDNEVFSKPEFESWAKDNVVLLKLDYPNRTPQPAAIKRQNNQLKNKYEITGFPTVLFLDAKGQVLGKSGYRQGGAQAWVDDASKKIEPPEAMPMHRSLTEAIADAKEQDKLVVAIVSPKNNPSLNNRVEELTLDRGFAALASKVVLVQQNATGEGVEAADAALLNSLKTDLRLPVSNSGSLWVIDTNGDTPEALFKTSPRMRTESLVQAITASLPTPAYNGEWLEDFTMAQAIAAKEKRAMLLNFTGSDWCGWCIKLDNEVFSKPEFEAFAKEHLVLVKLDYPRQRPMPAEIVAQNKQLQAKYGIRGFPTIMLVEPDGEKIGQTGYREGGPVEYVQHLKAFLSRR